MKRPRCLSLLVVLLLTAGSAGAANTPWDLFQDLDWPARIDYLNDKAESVWPEEFLLQVLEYTDAARIETGSDNEVSNKRTVALKVIRILGKLPSVKAVPALARVAAQYRDPVLRGEAWLALARIGNAPSAVSMIRALDQTNGSGDRSKADEILASYLIESLGILKAPEAFTVLAEANQSWYTPASQLRPRAAAALALVSPDPDSALLALIETAPDLRMREGWFHNLTGRQDQTLTGRACSALLKGLAHYQGTSQADQDLASQLLLAALVAAQGVQAPPADLVAPLKSLVNQNPDPQIKAQSIYVLSRIPQPDALGILIATMDRYNGQQKLGANSTSDLGVVRALISALAATGKADARRPLDDAKYCDYTPGLIRDAQAALDLLPRE